MENKKEFVYRFTAIDQVVVEKNVRAREDVWKKMFNYYNKAHKSNLRRSEDKNYEIVREWALNLIDLEKNGV